MYVEELTKVIFGEKELPVETSAKTLRQEYSRYFFWDKRKPVWLEHSDVVLQEIEG